MTNGMKYLTISMREAVSNQLSAISCQLSAISYQLSALENVSVLIIVEYHQESPLQHLNPNLIADS